MHRTVDASCFGRAGAPPHFVALEHESPNYVYYFGELLLAFTVVHEGCTHECVFVEYLWPEQKFFGTYAYKEEPLLTKYERLSLCSADRYAVRPVEQAS